MRVLFAEMLLAVGIAMFVASAHIEGIESDDLADLADLGESYGREENMVGDALMASQDPTTKIETNDTLVAECYQNSLDEAKLHCESKVEEDQCSEVMRDWYCDAYQEHVCEADKPMRCRVVKTGAEDTFQDAKCCNWDATRTPKCSIDTADASGNKCVQPTDTKKLFD